MVLARDINPIKKEVRFFIIIIMIQKEDILKIAKELNIEVSDKRVEEILKDYPEYAENRPNDIWHLIVEDMLYE